MVLVVLMGRQLPRADGRIERVRVGDEVRVRQVWRQVMCGGESWGVGGRVALRRLGGHNHSADPCGIFQHLWERGEKLSMGSQNMKITFLKSLKD